MKNVIKKILFNISLFIVTILIIDIFLSSILDKEVYSLMKNKIELVPIKTDPMQIIDRVDVSIEWGTPYWEEVNNQKKKNQKKSKKCKVIWLWDSLMAWAWVMKKWDNNFMKNLWLLTHNTDFLNFWIPWATIEQEIIKYYKESEWESTDLLIWQIHEWDFYVYNLVDGILYNSNVMVHKGYPTISSKIPHNINKYFIKNSYIYNKLILLFNMNNSKQSIDRYQYVGDKMSRLIDQYQKSGNDKKVLFLFNIDISSSKEQWNKDAFDYNFIHNKFKNQKWIYFSYLHDMFNKEVIDRVKYDNCCHYKKEWHEIIANKLYKYIKTNQLLDESCF